MEIEDIVDTVDTVDTADIVHTVDTLDNVKSVNSVDNVSSVNSVHNVQMAHPNMEDANVALLNRPDDDFPDNKNYGDNVQKHRGGLFWDQNPPKWELSTAVRSYNQPRTCSRGSRAWESRPKIQI